MRAICLQARAEVSVQKYKGCSNRMIMTNDRISAQRPEWEGAGFRQWLFRTHDNFLPKPSGKWPQTGR